MKKYLEILGFKVRDKVTGVEGVATSVSFDLYGCVQVTIARGLDKDGKLQEQYWFDFKRLKLLSKEPVMKRPTEWIMGDEAGPEVKPLQHKV